MKKRQTLKKLVLLFLILSVTIGCYFYYYNKRLVKIIDEEIAMSGVNGVTPLMFGAKGDGKTNDSKALQTAIDYASKNGIKNVIIPEGVFSVKKIWMKKNVSLIGEGEKSILLADPSSKTWDGILYVQNLTSVNIRNITFDGNKPIVPGDDQKGTANMWVVSSSDVNITDCTFQNNWYLGICLKNSNNVRIENNKFVNLDCGVITTDKPSSNLLINNNYFDGADWSEPVSIFALKEGYHENITITNNVMKNHTKGSGILIRAAKSVVVKYNTIDNCCTGIYLTSSKYSGVEYGVYDATIEDNVITNCTCEGVLIENFNNSKLFNNTIEDSGVFGISVKGLSGSEISGDNLFYTNINNLKKLPYRGFSISVKNMTKSSIKDNKIDILEGTLANDRQPIIINENSATPDANNEFANNVVNPATVNVFAVRNN